MKFSKKINLTTNFELVKKIRDEKLKKDFQENKFKGIESFDLHLDPTKPIRHKLIK